jgi:predicted regulator of Ras-like GTPase activity (Roadblock/LC7/MglB family)
MLQEILRSIVERTDGAIASLLMGFDGFKVESFGPQDPSESPKDIEEIGIEFGVIVGNIRRAAQALQAGGTREVAILAEKMVTIIRVVNDDYFVALTMKPDGNPGKGRFMLRTAAPRLLKELS